MLLFHYTRLFHLPPIIDEGLWKGEVAQPDPFKHDPAVSLTTQTDPDRLFCWGESTPMPVKTTLRLTVDVDANDPKLRPARDEWKRLGSDPKFMRLLDPSGQAKWWYFFRGTLRPVAVELRGHGGYERLAGDQLAAVVADVRKERLRFREIVHPTMPYMTKWEAIDEVDEQHWLTDDYFPAGRWRSAVLVG